VSSVLDDFSMEMTGKDVAKVENGLSVTSLLGKAGPENFIRGLRAGLDPAQHGVVRLHFYTFGGFKATADWIAAHRHDF
jgi:methylenetetrahydrofolate reductase (NADPH)